MTAKDMENVIFATGAQGMYVCLFVSVCVCIPALPFSLPVVCVSLCACIPVSMSVSVYVCIYVCVCVSLMACNGMRRCKNKIVELVQIPKP